MWNEVVLIGNLGKDPEIRNTQGGDKVANFSLATSERWKQNGEQKERTEWHRIVVWGKLAEVVERYLQKGTTVAIRGQVKTRKWTDSTGAEKYTTEIVVQGFDAKLQILKGGRGSSEGQWSEADDDRPSRGSKTSKEKDWDLDDEIPF